MSGRHFCVPFSDGRDLEACLQIGQSVMLDNGAFSAFTRGAQFDVDEFYRWIDPVLGHPHWGVVPDVIGGDVDEQRRRVATWPFPRELGAPVYHLGLPLEWLFELVDEWPRICLGSSGKFWQVGSPSWCGEMDRVFNALAKRERRLPWIHGLRMLDQAGGDYPLASADSTNVGRNFKDAARCPDAMAAVIDTRQCPTRWQKRAEQEVLFT
jgi:hypothetical protein